MPAEILIIEDDRSLAMLYRTALASTCGHRVTLVHDGLDGLKMVQERDFEIILTDFKLPGLDGLELIERIHQLKPFTPVILITSSVSADTAIEAMKRGAYDCLMKPVEFPELIEVVQKALATSRAHSRLAIGETKGADLAFVGSSRGMRQLFKEIGLIAAKPVTVLIRGETGTGKELVAQALYQHSDRKQKPFVIVNCAAIPETLLESELFGHERGAFTGAGTRRIGRFEQADHGTLFLDEIGELTPGTQSKLLRALQEKTIQRLGSNESIPVDVRVVAATHRDLEQLIPQRQFREDLYYRLSDATLSIPALRERREDIPDLIAHFIARHSHDLAIPQPAVLPDAVKYLRELDWPGNVRQLQSLVRQAILASHGYAITLEIVRDLCADTPGSSKKSQVPFREYVRQILEKSAAAAPGEALAYARATHELEIELLSQSIQLARGNQSLAARWLGISRVTLRNKLNEFGLGLEDPPAPPATPKETGLESTLT